MAGWILVALGLAMDAFAVSISSGICIPGIRPRHALRAAFAFGAFQFAMPLLGWLIGGTFRDLIQDFDHWVAAGLLALIGGKMLLEALGSKEASSCDDDGQVATKGILDPRTLLGLAVATSVDALAVGLSYRMIDTPILAPAAVIGVVTFGLSLAGIEFGKRIGPRFGRWAEVAGGVVLVGMGLKILAEHLAA